MILLVGNLSLKKLTRLMLLGVFVTVTITIVISMLPFGVDDSQQNCNCNDVNKDSNEFKSQHKLAILVPFRDRFDELMKFIPHMHKFLQNQKINFKIFIINQSDSLRFNRASLINVGFIIVRNQFDYIAMHDVDLLPLNPNLSYAYPINGPFHIASPEFHPKYHYKTFVGGILLVTREQFEKVNGLSNKYWGWGLEDDEFYARLKEAGLIIRRPSGITTGINNTFVHIHDRSVRKRDTIRLYNQKEVTRKRDRQTGLDTVQYDVIGVNDLTIDSFPCQIYHIELKCDFNLTPWCQAKQGKNKTIK